MPHQAAGANLDTMRTLLNIIWFIFSGFWLWLAYVLAGIICCLLIITIPWGIASFRMASYAAWPFGRELVDKPTAGIFSFLGNVIWVIVAGWWIALTHVATGIAALHHDHRNPAGRCQLQADPGFADAAGQADREQAATVEPSSRWQSQQLPANLFKRRNRLVKIIA